GDVVLGLAGHDAAVAAGADGRIDDHGPGVALILVLRVHRLRALLGLGGIPRPLREGLAADDAAVAAGLADVEALVLLRAGDGVRPLVGERDDRAAAAAEGIGEAQRIDVGADGGAVRRAGDAAAVPAPVAELHGDDA